MCAVVDSSGPASVVQPPESSRSQTASGAEMLSTLAALEQECEEVLYRSEQDDVSDEVTDLLRHKLQDERDQLAADCEDLRARVASLEARSQAQQEQKDREAHDKELEVMLSPSSRYPGAQVPADELWKSLSGMTDRLFALPSHTLVDSSPNRIDSIEYVKLASNDPRRQWLVHHFINSFAPHRRMKDSDEWCSKADIEVLEVTELYNPAITRSYRHELAELKQKWPEGCKDAPELGDCLRVRTDLGGPALNEVLAFHGCKWGTQRAISNEGFDSRLFGQNAGALFGGGSYFATKASKADYYTDKFRTDRRCKNGDGRRCNTLDTRSMFVARVVLGSIHEALTYDPKLRRPPEQPAVPVSSESSSDWHQQRRNSIPQPQRHDSVLGVPRSRGGVLDYPELVVYKPSQAVPQFWIAYRHKNGCQCRTCVNPMP